MDPCVPRSSSPGRLRLKTKLGSTILLVLVLGKFVFIAYSKEGTLSSKLLASNVHRLWTLIINVIRSVTLCRF